MLVVAAVVAILIVAVLCAVRLRSPEQYFTGGRSTRRVMLALFAFGSGTSSDSQSSVMTAAWRFGLSGLWWQFIWLPFAPLYWILAPLLRRLRALTAADFFEMRFGSSTALLYSGYGILICIVLMATVLFSSARLIETLTHPYFGDLAARWDIQVAFVDLDAAFQPPGKDRQPAVVWKTIGGDELIAIGLGGLLMLVSMIGGLSASILIDAAHGVLRIGLTGLLLVLVMPRIGGWGALHAHRDLPQGMLDFVASTDAIAAAGQEPFTPFCLAALSAAALIGILVQPQILTICGAGQSELDARIGFTFGNLLKRTMAVLWSIVGLACVAWYLSAESPLINGPRPDPALHEQLRLAASPDLNQQPLPLQQEVRRTNVEFADRLFGRAIRDLTHSLTPGCLGLFAAMVVAAAVSHCGTQAVIASGLFVDHIYRPHVTPGRDPRHYLFIARICSPLAVGVALLLQTTFTDVTDAIKLAIKTPAIIGISMWMGLFWLRWNTAAVWCTTIAGALTAYLVGWHPEEILKTFPVISRPMFYEGASGLVMLEAWKVVCIIGLASIVGIIATVMTEPEPDDQLEHFYRVIRSPIRPDERGEAGRYEPPLGDDLAPAILVMGFQLPGPTRSGTIGFLITLGFVVGLVLATKWLSLQL